MEEIKTETTAIKLWRKNCLKVADNWVNCIRNNFKITRDNMLRKLYFKLWHRELVTNEEELKGFGITDCVKCVMCCENDSIEHAFFDCQSLLKLCDSCDKSLEWFNTLYKIKVSLTSLLNAFEFSIYQHQTPIYLIITDKGFASSSVKCKAVPLCLQAMQEIQGTSDLLSSLK